MVVAVMTRMMVAVVMGYDPVPLRVAVVVVGFEERRRTFGVVVVT